MRTTGAKNDRLSAITAIVSSEVISSQEELMDRLSKKGHNITQATLSRDIKKLKLIKAHTSTGYRYQIHTGKTIPAVRSNGILSVDASSNLMVIKTGPGFAAAVASTIDNNIVCSSIMGTIAGDDTVLLILRSSDSIEQVIEAVSQEFPDIKDKLI